MKLAPWCAEDWNRLEKSINCTRNFSIRSSSAWFIFVLFIFHHEKLERAPLATIVLVVQKVKIYAREIHQDDDDDRVSRAQSISSCTKYTQSLEASSIKCSIFEWFGAFVVFYTFIALLSSRLVCDLPLISCIWFYLSCYHEGFAP